MVRQICFVICCLLIAAEASAFPLTSRPTLPIVIEEAKARVALRSSRAAVRRKSSSVSVSVIIIRKERRLPRKKKYVIPDIPKPK